MRQKNTLEYLGLWERLYNPSFKGVEFDPLLAQAGSFNAPVVSIESTYAPAYRANDSFRSPLVSEYK